MVLINGIVIWYINLIKDILYVKNIFIREDLFLYGKDKISVWKRTSPEISMACFWRDWIFNNVIDKSVLLHVNPRSGIKGQSKKKKKLSSIAKLWSVRKHLSAKARIIYIQSTNLQLKSIDWFIYDTSFYRRCFTADYKLLRFFSCFFFHAISPTSLYTKVSAL